MQFQAQQFDKLAAEYFPTRGSEKYRQVLLQDLLEDNEGVLRKIRKYIQRGPETFAAVQNDTELYSALQAKLISSTLQFPEDFYEISISPEFDLVMGVDPKEMRAFNREVWEVCMEQLLEDKDIPGRRELISKFMDKCSALFKASSGVEKIYNQAIEGKIPRVSAHLESELLYRTTLASSVTSVLIGRTLKYLQVTPGTPFHDNKVMAGYFNDIVSPYICMPALGLWALTTAMICGDTRLSAINLKKGLLVCLGAAVGVDVVNEVLQYVDPSRGTYDPKDIAAAIAGGGLGLMMYRLKDRKRMIELEGIKHLLNTFGLDDAMLADLEEAEEEHSLESINQVN